MVGPKLSATRLSQPVAIIFMHGLLFGLNIVTFGLSCRWLLFTDEGWKLRKRFHWLLLIITILLGAFSVADATVDLRVISMQMYFIDAGHRPVEWVPPFWNGIVRCMIADTIALLADIVLMNRLWVVYDRSKLVMIFPIILWLGGVVCAILQIFLQTVHMNNPNFGPYQWAAVNMNVGPGIALTPLWASTTALNAYCTGLLIWRIWKVTRKGDSTFTKRLQFLIRILMESGILYLSVGLGHLFAWFGRNSFAISLLGTMNSATIPIAFNLVVIRTAQNRAFGEEPDYSSPELTTIHFTRQQGSSVGIESSIETGPTVYDLRGSGTTSVKNEE